MEESMEVESTHFDLDTKGICLFCLKSCPPPSPPSPKKTDPNEATDTSSKNDEERKKDDENCDKSEGDSSNQKQSIFDKVTSFKMLMRYLHVDVLNLFKSSTADLAEKLVVNEDLVVTHCDNCAAFMSRFWELYEDFETIRLNLSNCVLTLHDLIKQSKDEAGRVEEYQLRMMTGNPMELAMYSIAENVRTETIRKCCQKIRADPKVKLRYISITNNNTTPRRSRPPGRPSSNTSTSSPKSNNRQKTHSCTICGEIFEHSISLWRHKKSHSVPEFIGTSNVIVPSNSCPYCGKTGRDKHAVRLHMIRKHPLVIYADQLAPGTKEEHLSDAITSILERHLSVNKADKAGSFTCQTCYKSFQLRSTLRIHLIDCHFDEVIEALKPEEISEELEIEDEEQEMEDTSSNLSSLEGFFDLQEEHIDVKVNPFLAPASAAPPSFEQLSQICTQQREVSMLPPGSLMKHFSPISNDVLNSTSSLYSSQSSDEGSKSDSDEDFSPNRSPSAPVTKKKRKDHPCPECRKSFKSLVLLRRHRKAHRIQKQKDRPHNDQLICKFCLKVSTLKKDNRIHMLTKHTIHFLADKLPRGTTEELLSSIIMEVVDRHQTTYYRKEGGRIGCPYCSKSFPYRCAVKIHMLDHHLDEVLMLLEEAKRNGLLNGHHLEEVAGPSFAVNGVKRDPLMEVDIPLGELIIPQVEFDWEAHNMCSSCGEKFDGKEDLQDHILVIHPSLFFANRIPPGTTEELMEASIQGVLSSGKIFKVEGEVEGEQSQRYGCPLCSQWFSQAPNLRRHVLQNHLDNVLALLQGASLDRIPLIKEEDLDHFDAALSQLVNQCQIPTSQEAKVEVVMGESGMNGVSITSTKQLDFTQY